MGVDEPRKQRMATTDHAFAWLENGVHFRGRSDSHDPPCGHGNRVIGENGVDRRDRQHPAGFDHQVDGFFWWHLREKRLKNQAGVYRDARCAASTSMRPSFSADSAAEVTAEGKKTLFRVKIRLSSRPDCVVLND
jgi:hypothetical protein